MERGARAMIDVALLLMLVVLGAVLIALVVDLAKL